MNRTTYDKGTELVKETTSNRKIILIISKENYDTVLTDKSLFKKSLLTQYGDYPELFPSMFKKDNWSLYGYVPASKKQNIRLRRIQLKDGSVWQVHPSFIMPYMTCSTQEAEKYLFFRTRESWSIITFYGAVIKTTLQQLNIVFLYLVQKKT